MTTIEKKAGPARVLVVLAGVALSLASSRLAGAAVDGRWILEFESGNDQVQLTTKRTSAHGHHENSCSYAMSAFRGLSRPASATPSAARFELARDAGTLAFEGQLDSSGGAGRFSFAPMADFSAEMRKLGYASLSDE